MKSDNAITSVRAYFEDLFRFASSHKKPTSLKFSDIKGISVAKVTLKESILGLLPGTVKSNYRKAENFAIREI